MEDLQDTLQQRDGGTGNGEIESAGRTGFWRKNIFSLN
jgi:hypothetical protein